MAGKRRGGRLFFMPFFGGCGGRGLPRGRAVVTGFAAGAGRSVEGVRAGGGWSRSVRAPFFVVWGTGPPLFRGGRLFLGEGIVRGKLCREPPRRFLRRGGHPLGARAEGVLWGVGSAAAGMLRAEGRCVGALEGRGAAGVLFSCPFLGGGCGRKGCCGAFWAKGRCGGGVCCGGRGEGMAFGRAAGGAAAFVRRFLLFGGWSCRFFGGGRFFGGVYGGGSSAGRMCGGGVWKAVRGAAAPMRARRRGRGAAAGSGGMERMRGGGSAAAGRWRVGGAALGERERKEGPGRGPGEEGKRKKRSAKLPNASYGGSVVLRQGRWNKRSICGTRYDCDKYCANISPPSRDRKGQQPKSPCRRRSIRPGFQTSRS